MSSRAESRLLLALLFGEVIGAHGLLSYAFGTGILATAINLVLGTVSG